MVGHAALPAQKLDLVVDLPEGRGLVAREDVKRGEPLLEIPDASLITVERAVKESKLGPKHAELQEWSLLAAFLAEQALDIENGDESGVFAAYERECLAQNKTPSLRHKSSKIPESVWRC